MEHIVTPINLKEGIHYLVDVRKIISGVAVAYGDADHVEFLCHGNAKEIQWNSGQEVPDKKPLRPDSIFDLASVTKLFTGLAILILMEKGCLSLNDPVKKFDPRFTKIGDISVGSLLTFQTALKTAVRLDQMPSKQAALKTLFQISIVEATQEYQYYYTDMGAMVLKYVIESAGSMPFYSFLEKEILHPLQMNRTFSKIPDLLLGEAVCYNYGRIIDKETDTVDSSCFEGVPHDPKARKLNPDGSDLPGHAGLFSTAVDLSKFAQALLSDRLISRNTLLRMGLNRTGKQLDAQRYSQHLGCMCFSKHPIQTYSEVPSFFSDRSIASNGFTGNHLSIDPITGKFIIILANKIHNRIYRTDLPSDPSAKIWQLLRKDGSTYVLSENYTFLKDQYLKEPLKKLLFHL